MSSFILIYDFICAPAVFGLHVVSSSMTHPRLPPLTTSPSSSPPLPSPSGDGSNGGAPGWAALLLGPGEGLPAGRRGPELHPPSADRAVQRLPGEKQGGPHHLPLLLRAPGEPGEAAARCKWTHRLFTVLQQATYRRKTSLRRRFMRFSNTFISVGLDSSVSVNEIKIQENLSFLWKHSIFEMFVLVLCKFN